MTVYSYRQSFFFFFSPLPFLHFAGHSRLAAWRTAGFGNDGCVSHLLWLIIYTAESLSHHFNTLSSARGSARGKQQEGAAGKGRFGRGSAYDEAATETVAGYLGVALHGVDERLISHDLRVSVEEGLETVLGLLQLLLGDLGRQTQRGGMNISGWRKKRKKKTKVRLFQCEFTIVSEVWRAGRLDRLARPSSGPSE